MRQEDQDKRPASRPGLYQEITDKIVAQIEAGTIPWVQPWAENQKLSIPRNAATNRAYSGVNILLLWDALFARGYAVNRWLTFKQALTFGGNVRKADKSRARLTWESHLARARWLTNNGYRQLLRGASDH